MARQRRGSGGRRRGSRYSTRDLQSTFETLIRNTLDQVGAVTDAALRQARSSRMRIDSALLARRRREALAELGEAVYELAAQGKLPGVLDHPDLMTLMVAVEDIDDGQHELAIDPENFGDEGFSGERFQSATDSESGTVSSATWTPPAPRSDEPLRMWRPAVPDDPPDGHADGPLDSRADDPPASDAHTEARAAVPEPAATRRRSRRARRSGRGGIAFVSDPVDHDDDLSEYMHDDDVPPE